MIPYYLKCHETPHTPDDNIAKHHDACGFGILGKVDEFLAEYDGQYAA